MMTRETIDFGIDLGTTNSSIAVSKGTDQLVIKNNEGLEYTPSVVRIDKDGRLIVGRRAKERADEDYENAYCEFKRQMGTNNDYIFKRSGRQMKPWELSAEVLKSLKADVRQRLGEELQAAVITVPAAFDLPKCEATKRAAQLAGFTVSALVQEPVAAAMAYGFESEEHKGFWFMYDLGGGTFDAAIVRLRDGGIRVVNHGGDEYLGGKDFDWGIVEQLLIPELTREFRLTEFRRGNPKWAAAINKLKLHAESAKILVSVEDSALIDIDPLCLDDRGDKVSFEFELKRADVERLAEPFILKTINICKKVLEEKGLNTGNIEKICLVGGPTLMPYLRERLADRVEGLGIPLDFSQDPLTVVARGASIIAGTQRLEVPASLQLARGEYAIELDYKPSGMDTEPLVGGRIVASEGEDISGFVIEFVNSGAKQAWRSGKLGIGPDGTFITNVWAEKGENTYLIELFDQNGNRRETTPDRFSYKTMIDVPQPTLIHSLGVALANNEMEWFFEKGVTLPARKRVILHTAIDVRQGREGDMIRIPVMEGQHRRADRNRKVGQLVIHADKIPRDIPAGQEVETTIIIDKDRLITAKAYLPILDEEYEDIIKLSQDVEYSCEDLHREIDEQKKRLESNREKASRNNEANAQRMLQRIDAELMVPEVESAAAAAPNEIDAKQMCKVRILALKAALDEIDDVLEWPELVIRAKEELEVERKIIINQDFEVTSEEKATFATLERELAAAMESRDVDVLARKVRELDGLGFRIMVRQPGWWVRQLNILDEQKSSMTNQSQAEQYFAQANRAIQNNDIESLKAAVRQLYGLLPASSPERTRLSDVMR